MFFIPVGIPKSFDPRPNPFITIPSAKKGKQAILDDEGIFQHNCSLLKTNCHCSNRKSGTQGGQKMLETS